MNLRRVVAKWRHNKDDRRVHLHWRDRLAISDFATRIGRWIDACRVYVDGRRSRPWLAMVAVPLAMNITTLALLVWTWPVLIICIWWWADRSWRWRWIVGVEAAAFGTMWTTSFVYALAGNPGSRLIVGAIWIALASTLAAVSAYNRQQNGSSPSYPGY